MRPVAVPSSIARGSIGDWIPKNYDTPVDLRHAVLAEVDDPALAGNDAGYTFAVLVVLFPLVSCAPPSAIT